jgi:mRNA interferase YafQ
VNFSPTFSSQFKKDFKLCRRRGLPVDELQEIVSKLANDQALAPRNRAHVLKGEYQGFWECHIRPDWLLIWYRDEEAHELRFARTGSHSDLFD